MPYCTREDVDLVYGQETIYDWADINGNDDGERVKKRIQWAIDRACRRIDSRLRCRDFDLPFDPVPLEICDIAAQLAGYYLWFARMLDKTDKAKDNLSHMQDDAEGMINEIISGQTSLSVGGNDQTSAPTVVCYDEHAERKHKRLERQGNYGIGGAHGGHNKSHFDRYFCPHDLIWKLRKY